MENQTENKKEFYIKLSEIDFSELVRGKKVIIIGANITAHIILEDCGLDVLEYHLKVAQEIAIAQGKKT